VSVVARDRTAFETWVRGFGPLEAGQSARLLCFPFAGGGASAFRSWEIPLSPRLQVCPVQLPGREDRIAEPAPTSVGELVDALLPMLGPVLREPFAFFGHSMGALIAYELARAIDDAHAVAPIQLFASAHRAPHLPDPQPHLHELAEHELVEELERLEGTLAAVFADRELRELALPLVRADLALCGNYRHVERERLRCPIFALGGLADPQIPVAELEAWVQHTSATFRLRLFSGGHFFIRDSAPEVWRTVLSQLDD
jgi:medium-chain acyl-[acyl-carrier-protein] hydrolase